MLHSRHYVTKFLIQNFILENSQFIQKVQKIPHSWIPRKFKIFIFKPKLSFSSGNHPMYSPYVWFLKFWKNHYRHGNFQENREIHIKDEYGKIQEFTFVNIFLIFSQKWQILGWKFKFWNFSEFSKFHLGKFKISRKIIFFNEQLNENSVKPPKTNQKWNSDKNSAFYHFGRWVRSSFSGCLISLKGKDKNNSIFCDQ